MKKQAGFAPIIVILLILIAFVVLAKLNQNQQNLAAPEIIQPKIASSDPELKKYLTVEAALLGISDNMSLSFLDLNSNQTININPEKSWIPASTIKAYVLLEAFRQRDLGLINFNQTVTIQAQNVVPTELETDEFPRLREGTTTTTKQLVEAMIIQSDNTAYNSLIDILDRRNINLALKSAGLTETVVGEKLNLDDNQFQQDLTVPGRQPNTTTVKDLTSFFDLLYNHKVADADEMLAIFKRQKINNMIPALLPSRVVVAHKTGDWAPIYHDGGIIYKNEDPFILSVFTSGDDPTDIAQLARVAYFQSASVVGQVSVKTTSVTEVGDRPTIALASIPNNVLAAESNNFPSITAADLGVTAKDLNFNTQVENVSEALVTPDSPFYPVKRWIENFQLSHAASNARKAEAYLDQAKSRSSEVKRLVGLGKIDEVNSLLKESEIDLEAATNLSQHDPDKDELLLEVKRVNDSQFGALAQKSSSVADQQKQAFIDSVYNFTVKNQQEIKPVVNASVVANPLQQKPAIGTVVQVNNGVATVNFDDGSQKEVVLNSETKVRAFQQDNYQNAPSVIPGDKIAIVGLTNSKFQIVPQFILKDVPKELPNKQVGTVIEINPNTKTLEIINQKGDLETVEVGSKTLIKSTDTSVSLEGIKAGSVVTVFGVPDNNPSSTSPSGSLRPDFTAPSPSPSTSAKPLTNRSLAPVPSVKINPIPSSSKPNFSIPSLLIQIKATTITITTNSSGKNEKISKPQPAPKSQPVKSESPKPSSSKK